MLNGQNRENEQAAVENNMDTAQPKNSAPTLIPASLMQIADVGAKLGALVAIGLYSAGVIIISIHLQRYGLFRLELGRTEYLIAGLLWSTLVLLTFVLGSNLGDWFRSFRKRGWTVRTVALSVVAVVSGFALEIQALYWLGFHEAYAFKWKLWASLGVLAWNALSISNIGVVKK